MMYGERAELYDRIYHFKDYEKEAEELHALLQEEGVSGGSRLLEAACGTGSYLVTLGQWYEVSGFDLSPEMLAIARRKLPDVPLFEADMCTFSLDRPVDALLCLFSSIGYAVPDERLRAAMQAFAAAVRPGGLCLVEPWIFPEAFRAGLPYLHTYEDDDLKLCRGSVSRREGDDAVIDFHWLVVRRDAAVEYFEERHVLRLYTHEQMTEALEAAGFDVRFKPEGRGLYIARRR